MNILLVSWHVPAVGMTSGGLKRTYEIIKRIPRNTNVIVIDTQPSFLRDLKADNIHFVEYKIPSFIKILERRAFVLERGLEWLWAMGAIIVSGLRNRKRVDVIYVPFSEMLVVSIAAYVVKLVSRKPTVFCNLNASPYGIDIQIRAFLHQRVDKVITVSNSLKEALKAQGITENVVVNTVGLDSELASRIDDCPKQYDAIFIGRHTKEKGIFDLVKAVGAITESRPDFRLLSLGSCSPPVKLRLQKELEQAKLEDNFIYGGVVSEIDKFEAIKNSRLCMFLSYQEGWGIVPLEALACGVPVVAYDLPAYQENIKPCEAVLLTATGAWQEAAKKVIHILQLSDKDYLALGSLGKEFVKQFGWEEIAERELQLLRSII